jgi:hypothetical protein
MYNRDTDDARSERKEKADAIKAAAIKSLLDEEDAAFYAMTQQQHIDRKAAIKATYKHIPCKKCRKTARLLENPNYICKCPKQPTCSTCKSMAEVMGNPEFKCAEHYYNDYPNGGTKKKIAECKTDKIYKKKT